MEKTGALKKELMLWLNYMDELLEEEFISLIIYNAAYPEIVDRLTNKKSALIKEMDAAYEILTEL